MLTMMIFPNLQLCRHLVRNTTEQATNDVPPECILTLKSVVIGEDPEERTTTEENVVIAEDRSVVAKVEFVNRD